METLNIGSVGTIVGFEKIAVEVQLGDVFVLFCVFVYSFGGDFPSVARA